MAQLLCDPLVWSGMVLKNTEPSWPQYANGQLIEDVSGLGLKPVCGRRLFFWAYSVRYMQSIRYCTPNFVINAEHKQQ